MSSLLLLTNSSIRPSNLSQNLLLLLFRRRLKGIISITLIVIFALCLYAVYVCIMRFFCTRLDEKDPPYDLVFEDSELLAGKVRKCLYSFLFAECFESFHSDTYFS